MKKTTMVILVVLALIAAPILFAISGYNSMVSQEEQVNQAWAAVEVNYQRRADLIPNLVSTVQGAADHEASVLKEIAGLRSGYQAAKTPSEYSALDQQFQKSLQIVVENYPQLRANENFLSLQDELAGTENRVAVARKDYNEVATTFNTTIRRFPKNLLAGLFGFEKRELFQSTPGSEKAPTVSFGSGK